jgi:hypothetical protein
MEMEGRSPAQEFSKTALACVGPCYNGSPLGGIYLEVHGWNLGVEPVDKQEKVFS